mgnify:CR=1 FL=1
MTTRLESALALWAALLGLCGVATAAVAAHLTNATSLNAAALILLSHAPAIIASLAASRSQLLNPRMGIIAAGLLALGATLFSSDIAFRVFWSTPLFPMAAPAGGFILMIGWGFLAFSALASLVQRVRPRDNDKTLG